MKVQELMTRDPHVCELDTVITSVLQIMKNENVGIVPVVDSSSVLQSVITDRDIALSLIDHAEEPAQELLVKDCIANDHFVVSVSPEDDVEKVLDLMEANQIRRIPVQDENAHCIGIISQADIARQNEDPEKTAELLQAISED